MVHSIDASATPTAVMGSRRLHTVTLVAKGEEFALNVQKLLFSKLHFHATCLVVRLAVCRSFFGSHVEGLELRGDGESDRDSVHATDLPGNEPDVG